MKRYHVGDIVQVTYEHLRNDNRNSTDLQYYIQQLKYPNKFVVSNVARCEKIFYNNSKSFDCKNRCGVFQHPSTCPAIGLSVNNVDNPTIDARIWCSLLFTKSGSRKHYLPQKPSLHPTSKDFRRFISK